MRSGSICVVSDPCPWLSTILQVLCRLMIDYGVLHPACRGPGLLAQRWCFCFIEFVLCFPVCIWFCSTKYNVVPVLLSVWWHSPAVASSLCGCSFDVTSCFTSCSSLVCCQFCIPLSCCVIVTTCVPLVLVLLLPRLPSLCASVFLPVLKPVCSISKKVALSKFSLCPVCPALGSCVLQPAMTLAPCRCQLDPN